MEEYLKRDYGVIEDQQWLREESDIAEYFEDVGSDYLDCGQGFYQDEAIILAYTPRDSKFWEVVIKAEVSSAKQDVGDRLYWVESIETVTYHEVEKPKEKERKDYTFTWSLTEDELKKITNFVTKLTN